ncbi:MAG: DUF885 family protein, partial [Catenulispora sp.]|nr:DUF885 family protein [Catenulispora sp.]
MADTPDIVFERLATAILDGLWFHYPDWASTLGLHEHDARLPDRSAAGLAATSAWAAERAAELAEIDTAQLSAQNRVDAAILAGQLALMQFQIDDLREPEWNPAEVNPGTALYTLLARDYAAAATRLTAFAGRLRQVPASLSANRELLTGKPLSRIHLELAIGQFEGTVELLGRELDAALETAPEARPEIDAVRPAALEALREHITWLKARLAAGDAGEETFRDPRIGAELFARKLSLYLAAESDAAAILARAEADLDRVTDEITRAAAEYEGVAVPESEQPGSAEER